MSVAQIYDPASTAKPVTLTADALKHVKKQIAKLGHGKGLRLTTKKSGCTGFAYVVEIIDQSKENDHIFVADNDVMVVVAANDYPIVKGTEIDYVREGLNARFVYRNPNETISCGCGESFSVD